MNRKILLSTCAVALSLTGCFRTVGSHRVVEDRRDYGISLSESWKEQMLLDIVKIRYIDPVTFVDIGNIVTSYTMSQTVNASGAIQPWNPDSGASVGVAGIFSKTPTVTYTPLTGSKFIQAIVTPLPAPVVFSAIENGSAADAIMLTTVSSINGLKNQQATLNGFVPADPEFHRLRTLMRKIQLAGVLRLYVRADVNKQQHTIVTIPVKGIPPEVLADSREVRRLLGLSPDATEFTLVSGPNASSDTEIAVQTRSVLGLLQNLAAQVQVPHEDVKRVFPGFQKDNAFPGIAPMVRIYGDTQKPADAYVTVKYRNTWFWIDDEDLQSKQIFNMLMLFFTMADTGQKDNLPTITIPAR